MQIYKVGFKTKQVSLTTTVDVELAQMPKAGAPKSTPFIVPVLMEYKSSLLFGQYA